MRLILLIFFIILLLILAVSYRLLRYTSHPKFFTTQQSIDIERSKGYLEGYDELQKQDYIIRSYDGYELHSTLIPYPGSKKVVIVVHGHTYTRYGSIKYLMMFRRLGYNAVIYDDRGHGDNKPAPVTMGYRESKDLMAVIKDTKQKFGSDCYLGLHGESMGSATILQALKFHPDVKFLVSDCGYSDLMYFTKMYIKDGFHLPTFFVDIANVLCNILYGYHLNDVSPITYVSDNDIPVCFIHGGADKLINVCNAKRLYDADHGYKELHIFEHAGHACSYAEDKERYFSILQEFLSKVEGGEIK